jgi:hypothetical protein
MGLVHHRGFLLLWSGQVLSLAGDWALRALVLLWVFRLTHSGLAVRVVGLTEALPLLVLAPVADAYVDRWHRAYTMAGPVLARAALVLRTWATAQTPARSNNLLVAVRGGGHNVSGVDADVELTRERRKELTHPVRTVTLVSVAETRGGGNAQEWDSVQDTRNGGPRETDPGDRAGVGARAQHDP